MEVELLLNLPLKPPITYIPLISAGKKKEDKGLDRCSEQFLVKEKYLSGENSD